MFRRSLIILSALTILAMPVMAGEVNKDGSVWELTPGIPGSDPSRDDFEFNTGGTIGFLPTSYGTPTGWGTYIITTVLNDSGQDIYLSELGFPCGGPGPVGWYVWVGVGGFNPPPGDWTTATFDGMFTPTDPDATGVPNEYSYIDVYNLNIVIPAGVYFTIGYENPGACGLTDFNGYSTWAWYGGAWDYDGAWGVTSIHEVKAMFEGPVEVTKSTWGGVKALFH